MKSFVYIKKDFEIGKKFMRNMNKWQFNKDLIGIREDSYTIV